VIGPDHGSDCHSNLHILYVCMMIIDALIYIFVFQGISGIVREYGLKLYSWSGLTVERVPLSFDL
jgi:hypothetical protein